MPELSKTRDQLVARALSKLGVVAAGQPVDAEDADAVDQTVDAVLADLATRSVYFVGNPEEIDISAFEWLAMILANFNAEDFGRAMDAGKQQYAESMLRILGSAGPTREVLKTEYY